MKNLITLLTLIICISANSQVEKLQEIKDYETAFWTDYIKSKEQTDNSQDRLITKILTQLELQKKQIDSLKQLAFEVPDEPNDKEEPDSFPIPEGKQLAFVGAKGAGAYTSGGRGGEIYHVTNLNDSGSGSLRDAVSKPNRMLVFDVSGIVELKSILGFSNNISIFGQTSPEGGITLTGARVFIGGKNNLIVRYLRFKNGVDGNGDSVTVRAGAVDQIWDHCTFGYGVDEGASFYEASGAGKLMSNITVQRCLFSENSKGSIIGAQSPAVAGDFTFVENLFVNSGQRTPNVVGENANIDVINNVVWNQNTRLIRGNESYNLNHINNYVDYGSNPLIDNRLNLHASYENSKPQIYTSGNVYVAKNASLKYADLETINKDNTKGFRWFTTSGSRIEGELLPNNYFVANPFELRGYPFTILYATEAFESIKNDVGCNARLNADGSVSENLDVEDAYALERIKQGVYYTKTNAKYYDVKPFASVKRPDDFYVSNPHIPEVWFKANVPEGEDHNYIMPNGKTAFENYVNSIDK